MAKNVPIVVDDATLQQVVAHGIRQPAVDAAARTRDDKAAESRARQPFDLILNDLHAPAHGGPAAVQDGVGPRPKGS